MQALTQEQLGIIRGLQELAKTDMKKAKEEAKKRGLHI